MLLSNIVPAKEPAMLSSDDFKAKRLEHSENNAKRAKRLLRRLPEILSYCEVNVIDVRELPNSYQFKKAGIALMWWPSSNKVVIQRIGGSVPEAFEAEPTVDEPKIIKALKWLAAQ